MGHFLGVLMSKKIVYMGTPEYATVILEKLVQNNYEIQALFTQPDKKVGREQLLTPSHIKQYCLNNNCTFPIYQPETLKDEEMVRVIKDLKPDYIIACYDMSVAQLKDADRPRWVRHYFNLF